MTRIRVYVSTNLHGSKVEEEFDGPDDWDEMSEAKREEYLDHAAKEHLSNSASFGAYIVEEDCDDRRR